MYVKFNYFPLNRNYKSNRGLAEKLVKTKLEKSGWLVFRGGYLHACRKDELYPNIRNKYSKLEKILGDKLEFFQLLSSIHHGMPDYFCYRYGKMKFVEAKFGHEQLAYRQKICIRRIIQYGVDVEIHKIVFGCTKIRSAMVDIFTNEKKIIEKQKRLNLKN